NARLHVKLAPDGGFAEAADPNVAPIDVTSLAARARVLSSLPLLRGVPTQILVELADTVERRALAQGESLFVAGAAPGRVFVVTRGRIEASRASPDVRATFAPGAIVGGALCMGDADAAWTARATEPSEVIAFAIEDLLDHLEEHAPAIRAMMAA